MAQLPPFAPSTGACILKRKDTAVKLPAATLSAISMLESISGADRAKASDFCERALEAATAGKYNVAMHLYGESLALNPFDSSTYALRSITCAVAGKDLDRAMEDAEKSLELEVTARGYRAKGTTLMSLDRLDEALAALLEGLKVVGDDIHIRALLLEDEGMLLSAVGNKAFEAGNYEEAINLYGKAHDCCPTKYMFLANRSCARRMLGQWELAIADTDESLRIQPTVYGYAQKARAYSDQGRCAEAILALDAGLALDEGDEQLKDLKVENLNWEVERALSARDYEKAVELCNAVLKIRPQDKFSLVSRAWCRRSDTLLALQDVEQSLRIEPTPWGYHVKGTVLNDMNRYKEAIVAFSAGLAIGGASLTTYQSIEDAKEYAVDMQNRMDKSIALSEEAVVAASAANHDRAIELYNQAIKLDPSAAVIWCLRGSSWLAKQVWDKALEDAFQSVELDPTIDGYCIMANALRGSARYSEAVEAFEAAGGLVIGHVSDSRIRACVEQDAAKHWLEKGRAATEHRDHNQSDEFLTIALAFDPCDAMLYASRSQVRIKQERWSAALHDADKCLHWQPGTDIGYLRKFQALYGAKDYDAAIKTILIAVKESHVPNVLDDQYAVWNSLSGNVAQVLLHRWRDPDLVAVDILRMTDDISLAMPPRLFDTFTGRLCERDDVFTTFQESNDYKHLLALAASGQLVDLPTIRNRVESFFQYAMLSHRWDRSRSEPVRQDIIADIYSLDKPRGVEKLQKFCRTAKELGYRWAWSDTCCIDKANSTEVQKSITSMATWHQRSALTIVYLADVSDLVLELFQSSDWFTRGWTLQELLAPRVIRFYKGDWSPLLDTPFNHKEHEQTLNWLCKATGIDKSSLRRFAPNCDDARETLRWASKRRTTEEEDTAYSLMGIFDLQIPVMYGELKQKALGRLLQEVVGSSGDLSVLQWSGTSGSFSSCLPSDISAFQEEPWKPHELSDSVIKESITRLRQKITMESDEALNFQQKLQSYHPAPIFQHGRLTLTCIVHHVDTLQGVVKRGSPRDCGLYDVQAQGLKPFQVTIESTEDLSASSPLRNRRDFMVIRPWNPDFHNGLTPDASRDPARLALEACVQLEQPFYGLLLSRRRRGYYRRIAGAVVEVKDIVDVLGTMSIERLEIS